ncbi:hypothetical protein POX_b02377 [Penicillium oxalicum]|uniref:hypothetical protein n=1 Tax=Penicillium oxalicum TaxID=69781 RepID=UPI0020B8958C|nr:hypothetical protein POX_b02377 [Penicillium oxalicum]KAI2792340.1 hypothetical protein POX_b02377 [Penicillium oxalicum]
MSIILPLRGNRLSALPAASSASIRDPLSQIQRQADLIQKILQELIDAQSEGLAVGLGQPSLEDTLDCSTTRAPVSALRAGSLSKAPGQRSTPTPIGLRAARRGIARSMHDLLKLRQTESSVLLSQEDQRAGALDEIRDFKLRREGLEEALSSIFTDRESQEAGKLRKEASALDAEIGELETRLCEMKARHRNIISKISRIENSVDAKRSSYTEALSLLQSDVDNYLRNPPVQQMSGQTNESSFYSLKPDRRTLELAQEQWKLEQEHLHQRRREVDAEIAALEEGGDVWNRAIADISEFESLLRTQMCRHMELQSSLTFSEVDPTPLPLREIAVKVSRELDRTISRLDAFLELANQREWKLLVCCLSAELAALHEAKRMLLPAFGIPSRNDAPPSNGNSSEDQDSAESPPPAENLSHDEEGGDRDSEPPADLLQDDATQNTDTVPRSDDDEPDPAWL